GSAGGGRQRRRGASRRASAAILKRAPSAFVGPSPPRRVSSGAPAAVPAMIERIQTMTAPVVVTGAAGFIGMHTCRRLLRDGRRVVGIDNLNAYYDPRLKRARLATLEAQEGF